MIFTRAICSRILAESKILPLTYLRLAKCSMEAQIEQPPMAAETKKPARKRSKRISVPQPVSLPEKRSDVRKLKMSFRHENDPDIPPFVDVDPYNSKLVRMLTSAKTKRMRYANMTIMLEGKRLIQEALAANLTPLLILFSRKKLLKGLALDPAHIDPEHTIVHYLNHRHMVTWSSLTTCPGIIGLFRMPNLEQNISVVDPLPITLVCDNIRDPGNLGSVLRVAAAIPVQKVILLAGCADIWDPKVTRGSCGAMFHLKIFNNASWDDVYDECSGRIILADHRAATEGIEGIEEDEEETCERAEDYCGDPEIVSVNKPENPDEDDTDEDTIEHLREIYKLPLKSYYDITFDKDESYVVVLGGETEGLSESSFRFASEKKGIRANIPVAGTVSSLNAATAFGIILFEIKRQIFQAKSLET